MSGEETKEKILKSAKELFIKHGFSGVSVGKIAKKAGINHSLIFHHFENKNKLWIDVKLSIFEEHKHQESIIPSTNLSFSDFIHAMVTNVTAFYRQHPELIRMIQWQRLEIESASEIGMTSNIASSAWLSAFECYQEKGDMKSSIQPIFALTFALSIISSAALDGNAFLINTEEQQAYLTFCGESLYHVLKA